ncbi:metal-dependent hydrolase [Paenibacillus sp. CF384]|uniref:metal-dependent hydrolase n=1 Tax=Paenibacillus sp. CF384 TaxID=1884382 RepID=UPI000897E0FF|nr:metal-dependent hydrolase [Paenibacillus sp. CF384]SDX87070.1 L-ascorbate metabolism protein UlaG, beta-lactamase superfamily [Paenibacillus sp. CF384]
MKIQFHGHACIQISTGDKSLVIDPFLSGNPVAVMKPEALKTDAILLTHAHQDHIQDAAPVAIANDAPIVAIVELATYMSWQGAKTIGMNMGGTVDLGFAKAKMVQAFHSSGIVDMETKQIMYAGMPAGYLVFVDGLTILHAGDTSLFSDMKLIGERHSIDIAFIPIGDHYTMGPGDALQAAAWYNAKLTIPIHHSTFPPIKQDAELFVRRLEEQGLKGKVMAPGDELTLEAN